MILKITLTKNRILYLLLLALMPFAAGEALAQTRIYATTISSQSQVDFAANATDQNTGSRAQVRANSGVALGIGAYSGHIELRFPSTLPSNTTSFVKIGADGALLQYLLGGNLGGLLADVAGGVLLGTQEFTVQVRNSSNGIVLSGDSQTASNFAGPRLRIVVNAAGEYFIMVTPNAAYDRIRLINRTGGSLVGLGTVTRLDVYDAFYVQSPANCGNPAFTSFNSTGLTLDAVNLGGAGVQNPQFAIDANPDNFSVLSLGILGAGASVEQTVYFEGPSGTGDQFIVRLRPAATLLDLNVANNIRVIASNGATTVQDVSLSTLLTLNLLNDQAEIMSVPLNPAAPVDRVTVRFTSLVGLSVAQSLDFYGVTRVAAPPAITDSSTVNAQACEGQPASLIATANAGNELRWYAAATGGTPLATVASGTPFTTPAITATTTFYVAAARIGCPEESVRVPVRVTVNTVPSPTTTDTTQEFCAFAAPTVANILVNEPGVVFYATSTGGTALSPATPLTTGTVYYAALIDTATGCQSATRLAITVTLTNTCGVTLNLRVMLQGALLNSADGLMRDNLRAQGLIPLNQPYSNALSPRFNHVNGGGNEATTPAVLSANAGTPNAIVDWVFVEVRDAGNPQTILRTVSALLQRDGDVVAANGGPLMVEALPATFMVAVKHRNHLGAMGAAPLTVANSAVTLDFTTFTDANLFALPGYTGQVAQATVNGVRALYTGNANFDTQTKYDGAANDRQVAAGQVLSNPGNTSQLLNYANATGYYSGDLNLDGRVIYDGLNNDRQLILNAVLTYPLNTNTLSNYNGMFEQVPQ